MDPIDSVTFIETSSGEECYVGVRAQADVVALVVSRKGDGDIEVLLDRPTATRIARALEQDSARDECPQTFVERRNLMSKRLCVVAAVALSQLTISPSICQAQAAQRITVEWQSAPFSHVIDAFARFSGRTIVMAPHVDGQEVTAAFQNVDWQLALDAILEKQRLVARKDSANVIHIEKRAPGAARITVEWQNAPLSHVIDAFARFSRRTIVLAPDVSEQDVTASFRNVDWHLVLDTILEEKGLVARADTAGVIRVEKRAAGR